MRPDASDWLRLCLVPGISGTMQRALLAAFGSPAAVTQASRSSVSAIAGAAAADALAAGPPEGLLASVLSWLDAPTHQLLALGDEEYPGALLQIPDPPTVLYAIGDTRLLNRPAFAIVGSRNATRQGALDAHEFARALSEEGYGIASGLALGIDAAAHRGGLSGRSSTIAVVGTGLDRVYPAANRDLAHEIAERGVMVSEFPLGTPPAAANFPRRNRLISGLSRGVLVVEAAVKSGSLITARLAIDQGREVFAIPGSIHSPFSKGCHWLIKQGAKLVESADDVLAELGGYATRANPPGPLPVGEGSDDPVLEALGHSPASVDALALRTGTPASALAAELTRLELAGRVERLPGGLFRQLAVP
ncbi:MAG: DNA-processing protein DprA [Betaproteobacteria bacterium]|nr:DNA-processing protein DprA [Betaproteobacteria bacterium]